MDLERKIIRIEKNICALEKNGLSIKVDKTTSISLSLVDNPAHKYDPEEPKFILLAELLLSEAEDNAAQILSDGLFVATSGGGSGGGSGAIKDAFTLTNNASRPVTAGSDVYAIRIKPSNTLTDFQVGSAPGTQDIVYVQLVEQDVWTTFVISKFFEDAISFYFQGITSSTDIVIIKI